MKKETENMPQSENLAPQSSSKTGPPAEVLAKAGYKHTPLGWLPGEWEVVRFEEIMSNDPQNGLYKPLDEYVTNGTPIVRIDNFNNGELGDPKYFKRVELSEEEIERYKLSPHDIVINRVNSITHVGKSALIPVLEEDTVFESNMMRISLNLSVASPEYVIRILVFPSFLGRLRLKAKTAIAQVSLNQHDIRSAPIPLPPLPEQQQIAAILSAWDRAIERTQALIAAKEERRKGVMRRLLTGRVRVKGFDVEWAELEFEEVFSFISSYAFSRENLSQEDLPEDPVFNIHYGDIHAYYSGKFIDFEKTEVPVLKDPVDAKYPDHYLVDGDLIMADASEDYKGVGECREIKNLNGRKALGGLHTFVIRDKKGLTIPTFRTYLFDNPQVRNKLRRIATGSSVYGISKKNLSMVILPLPSVQEQKAIAKILIEADREIELLTASLESLKDQKKGLMQQLLTGRIRVK